jgi:hypothetical protein
MNFSTFLNLTTLLSRVKQKKPDFLQGQPTELLFPWQNPPVLSYNPNQNPNFGLMEVDHMKGI